MTNRLSVRVTGPPTRYNWYTHTYIIIYTYTIYIINHKYVSVSWLSSLYIRHFNERLHSFYLTIYISWHFMAPPSAERRGLVPPRTPLHTIANRHTNDSTAAVLLSRSFAWSFYFGFLRISSVRTGSKGNTKPCTPVVVNSHAKLL